MNQINLKEKILQIANDMEDDTTVDDVMEKLFVIYKVEKGLKQIEEGKFLTHAEVKDRVAGWFK